MTHFDIRRLRIIVIQSTPDRLQDLHGHYGSQEGRCELSSQAGLGFSAGIYAQECSPWDMKSCAWIIS